MATYLPGMTDYIPQIQPTTPDYNFLGNVLQTKQSKYDAAHKQLSSLYGSILNAPMTRGDNIAKREELFKTIDDEIKRVSGLDLSLQQNQDYASTVFDPILEDKNILKDMTWTKNFYNQVNRGEGFKLCTDAAKCGGSYWEPGMIELQYRRQEFMNASPEEAMNFQDVSFTPAINVMEDAVKKIKDPGFKVKYDQVSGGYIVTKTNGNEIVAPLHSYLAAMYGSNQQVLDYYKTQAYVNRKSWVDQNIDKYGGNEQLAVQDYIKDLQSKTTLEIIKSKKSAERDHDHTTQLKESFDLIAKEGVSAADKDFADNWNDIIEANEATRANLDMQNQAESSVKQSAYNVGNSQVFNESFDRQVAYAMMNHELYNAASAYQTLTQEVDIKADPYGLQAQAHRNAMEKMYAEKGHFDADGNYHAGLDVMNWKAREDYKKALEMQTLNDQLALDPNFRMGSSMLPDASGLLGVKFTETKSSLGTSDVISQYALRTNVQGVTDRYKNAMTAIGTMINSTTSELITKYDKTKDVRYKTLLDGMFMQTGSGINSEKLLRGDPEETAKLNNLSNETKNKIQKFIRTQMDPSGKGAFNKISSTVMGEYWMSQSDAMVNAERAIKDFYTIKDYASTQSSEALVAIQNHYDIKASDTEGSAAEKYRIKSELAKYLITNTSTGIFPVGRELEKLTNQFMAKNQDRFNRIGNMLTQERDQAPSGRFAGGFGRGTDPIVFNTQDFITESVNEIYGNFKTVYRRTGDAWNKRSLFGGDGTGAEVSGAFTVPYVQRYGANFANNAGINQTFSDWASSSEKIAQFSGAGALSSDEEERADAQMIATAYYNYLNKPRTSKSKDIPRNEFTYQDNALYSRDNVAMTFTPSIEFLNEYAAQTGITTKDDAKKTFIEKYNKPITLIMKANETDNMFRQATQVTVNDFRLENGKPIVVDYYPGAGSATITGNPTEGYMFNFNIKLVDENTGEEELRSFPVPKPYSTGLNSDMLEAELASTLKALQEYNISAKINASRKGHKGNPDQVVQALLNKGNQYEQ